MNETSVVFLLIKQRLYAMRNLKLMLQQPFFSPHTAGIANQAFIAANYTVAGNDDANLVFAIGCCHSAYGFFITDKAA